MTLGEHHSFALKQIMQDVEFLDQAIDELGQQIEVVTRPFAHQLENLQTIPGIERKGAELILAEVGTDMARFPIAGHLAAWAGVCPRNNESGANARVVIPAQETDG